MSYISLARVLCFFLCSLFTPPPLRTQLEPPPSPIHAASRTSMHCRAPPRRCHALRAATPAPRATHAAAPYAAAAAAALSRQVLAKWSTDCLIEMGHEKRKGKEVVVEKPIRKRTHAEREAERAEMVAKAAEEQASGRARPFAIREQPARGRGRGMGRVRGARATRATTQ